jgi:hypothetical protein
MRHHLLNTDQKNMTPNMKYDMTFVMSPQEVANSLRKSLRWVYKNAYFLGASKIGGSWIFTREGLHDAIQRGQRLESDTALWGPETTDKVVPIKKGSNRIRKRGQTPGKERRALAERAGFTHFL